MPQVVVSSGATADLERLTAFLLDANALVQANKLVKLLTTAFRDVGSHPTMGKAYLAIQENESLLGAREVKIRFGRVGYQFLFRYDEARDTVIILAIRHFREQGYQLVS